MDRQNIFKKALLKGATEEGFHCGGRRMMEGLDIIKSMGYILIVANEDMFYDENIRFFDFVSREHAHQTKKTQFNEVLFERNINIVSFNLSYGELSSAAQKLENWVSNQTLEAAEDFIVQKNYALAFCEVFGEQLSMPIKETIIKDSGNTDLKLVLLNHLPVEDIELWHYFCSEKNREAMERICDSKRFKQLDCSDKSFIEFLANAVTVEDTSILLKRLEVIRNYRGLWTPKLVAFGLNKLKSFPNPIFNIKTIASNSNNSPLFFSLIHEEEKLWKSKAYILERHKLNHKFSSLEKIIPEAL